MCHLLLQNTVLQRQRLGAFFMALRLGAFFLQSLLKSSLLGLEIVKQTMNEIGRHSLWLSRRCSVVFGGRKMFRELLFFLPQLLFKGALVFNRCSELLFKSVHFVSDRLNQELVLLTVVLSATYAHTKHAAASSLTRCFVSPWS